MNPVPLLSADDKVVRTQITLTHDLRELLENSGALRHESLSAYLRRAALLSLILDSNQQANYKSLADKVIGAVKLKSHPEWQTKKKAISWVRKTRGEWKS